MAIATRTITQIPGQFVTVEGLKTHYLATGTGHPLLIMHGGAPGGAARVIYGACIEPLAAQGLAVYAPDAPGFGLTGLPADNSVRYRIEHAKAFATAMGLDRYHVMGNSMGVLPSLRLAIEDPRVARVVLVAGAGVDVQLSPEAREIAREHNVVLSSYTLGLENMRALTMGTLHRKDLVSEELIQLRHEMSVAQDSAAREGRYSSRRPHPDAANQAGGAPRELHKTDAALLGEGRSRQPGRARLSDAGGHPRRGVSRVRRLRSLADVGPDGALRLGSRGLSRDVVRPFRNQGARSPLLCAPNCR